MPVHCRRRRYFVATLPAADKGIAEGCSMENEDRRLIPDKAGDLRNMPQTGHAAPRHL